MQIRFQWFLYSIFNILNSWRLRRPTPSWQFFWVCFAFVFGVAVASFGQIPEFVLGVILAVAVALFAFSYRRWFIPLEIIPRRSAALVTAWANSRGDRNTPREFLTGFLAFFGLLVVIAGLFGIARRQLAFDQMIQQHVRQFVGKEVSLRGQVTSPSLPQTRSVRFHFTLEAIEGAEQSVRGESVMVVARPFPEISIGDRLRLKCRLAEGEKARSGSEVTCLFPEIALEEKSGYGLLGGLNTIKGAYEQSLERVFPEPSAGFISGLLVGGQSGLSASWRNSLNATGTAHLVALSGYNVSVIAGFLLSILRSLSVRRRWRATVIGIILTLFVLMVGAGASIVRAAVMGMLVVLARQSGRTSSSKNAIAFAAVIMLFLDPTLLVADIGFQLSFLATIGMIYFYPILERRAAAWPNPLKFKEALLMAVAAEVFVTPFILYYFGRLSLVAPLVNMLVVPPIPYVMLFGFLGGLAGLIIAPLGQIVGFGGWLGATYVLGVIHFASRLPLAAVSFSIDRWSLIIYYVFLGGFLIWWHMLRSRKIVI